jgi:hypothetical protein
MLNRDVKDVNDSCEDIEADIEKAPEEQRGNIRATVVWMRVLEEKYADHRSEWQGQYTKAKKWLKTQGLEADCLV